MLGVALIVYLFRNDFISEVWESIYEQKDMMSEICFEICQQKKKSINRRSKKGKNANNKC